MILLVDSLTYLSKVYTTAAVQQGRQTIGMVNPVSLQKAKKLFGAARCLREGGSLTIFAVMNIETGSRVDDSIAEDLKGTANMELVLDTAAARAGIYPRSTCCSPARSAPNSSPARSSWTASSSSTRCWAACARWT